MEVKLPDGYIIRPDLLAQPNIPKPLHGLNPRTIMGQTWWDNTRQAAYAKARYRCQACGVPKDEAKYHRWLEAHEVYKIAYNMRLATFIEVVAICYSCHNYIHGGRLAMLAESSKIPQWLFTEIMQHGNGILIKYRVPSHYNANESQAAEWSKWSLRFNGKTYKSKFATYEDWEDFYSGFKLEED